MTVGVVMPALNAGRFIEAALLSLLREREEVALDIIVVDDGSTDDTRAITERLAAAYPEVHLFRNPRKGIAAGRNTGIAHMRPDCRYVTFHDADDISYPGRIARQRALLDADPAADVIYGLVEMFTEFDATRLAPAVGNPTKVLRGPYLQSSMYRPHVIRAVGAFDESYRQGDDSDYVLRVIEHHFNLVLDDGIGAYYRRHDANVTLNVAEVQREYRLASMKWAVRRRLKGEPELPPIFADLFHSRHDIEKGFAT